MCKVKMDYNDGSQNFLFLESPAQLLKIPVPRLCPRSIKPDSLEEGPKYWHFLKLLDDCYLFVVRFENEWIMKFMVSIVNEDIKTYSYLNVLIKNIQVNLMLLTICSKIVPPSSFPHFVQPLLRGHVLQRINHDWPFLHQGIGVTQWEWR